MAKSKRRRQSTGQREAVRLAAIHKEATRAGMHASWMMLAASCLALREMHGFGQRRIEQIVKRAQRLVFEALSAQELIDRLRDEIGVDIEQIYTEQELEL